MKAVIMAGGRGSRIAAVNSDVPKPMLKLCGKPVLEYQLEWLKEQGIKEAVLVVGYLQNIIMDYFGDGRGISPATGKFFGIHLSYIREKEPLGTAGALYYLKEKIKEDFLLINGDIVLDIDLKRLMNFHYSNGGAATILVHPNNHPYDSGVIVATKQGLVTEWLHKEDKRTWYRNRVNAGVHVLSPKIFEHAGKKGLYIQAQKIDLDREILKPLIPDKMLFSYDSPEYVKDMGTPDRYKMIERDVRLGKVKARNLSRKQKAVFLDRDGTINKYCGYIRKAEELVLLPFAGEAIKKLNDSGYLVIVVTNQPVIARGEITEEELNKIHNRLETLLGEKGAYIDDIYFCPHHPDKGFPGEIVNLKIPCKCRKPEPGMLFMAAEKYNIDLKNSWMAGDSESDIKAGKSAGCRTAGIGRTLNAEVNFNNLNEFADYLLRG